MVETLDEFCYHLANDNTTIRRAIEIDGERINPRKSLKHGTGTIVDVEKEEADDVRYEYSLTRPENDNVIRWYQYKITLNPEEFDDEAYLLLESDTDLEDNLRDSPIPPNLKLSTDDDSQNGIVDPDNPQPAGVRYVAGLEEEKQEILEFLENVPQDWGLTPETGLLLCGPPGTGKTQLVTEICKEHYGSIPVVISGPEILSRWVGESERLLREKFKEAGRRDAKVLYIDEIDSIARSRAGTSQEHSAQLVAQLLVLLDGVDQGTTRDTENVQVIASTNMPGVLDPALTRPGRFGSTVQFSETTEEEGKAILHHYLEDIHHNTNGSKLSEELETFVTSGEFEDINDRTDVKAILQLGNQTGADIESMVRKGVKVATKSRDDKLDISHLMMSS